MNSTILNITARYLSPVIFLLSLIVLYRGHNYPGGGFIGGLLAVSACLLVVLARGWEVTESKWWPDSITLLVTGLAVTAVSGILGVLAGEAFLTGLWLPALDVPLLGKVKLGTPLLFDLGVYLAVMGFSLKCASALGQEDWS
ncbi:MAG: MnhB domain-containing protein [Puniceicoccaceae bacterium]